MASVFEDYIKMGEEKGLENERERVAKDMLLEGEPLAKIKKFSKLPEAAIRKLAKNIGVAVL